MDHHQPSAPILTLSLRLTFPQPTTTHCSANLNLLLSNDVTWFRFRLGTFVHALFACEYVQRIIRVAGIIKKGFVRAQWLVLKSAQMQQSTTKEGRHQHHTLSTYVHTTPLSTQLLFHLVLLLLNPVVNDTTIYNEWHERATINQILWPSFPFHIT